MKQERKQDRNKTKKNETKLKRLKRSKQDRFAEWLLKVGEG
ncbi:10591_t:CDS:1, partial [Rhizophagus irregularis]